MFEIDISLRKIVSCLILNKLVLVVVDTITGNTIITLNKTQRKVGGAYSYKLEGRMLFSKITLYVFS